MTIQQQDKEDLVDHYKRFLSLNEMADRACGKIVLCELLQEKHDSPWKGFKWTLLAKKNQMLAHMFMDGANKKTFGCLPKNMSDNHTLGTEKHLEDVETALQTMMLHSQ